MTRGARASPISPTEPCGSTAGGERRSVTFEIRGPLSDTVVEEVCARFASLLDRTESVVVACDVGELGPPDLAYVDALARMQLIARRRGRSIELHRACPTLRAVLDLVGLSAVLPCAPGSAVGVSRETEEGEQRGGVEEEVHLDDPAVG